MTTNRPIVDTDARYSQSAAARLLGVDRHTLRRWELAGHFRFSVRTAGRGKYTTGREILRAWEQPY